MRVCSAHLLACGARLRQPPHQPREHVQGIGTLGHARVAFRAQKPGQALKQAFRQRCGGAHGAGGGAQRVDRGVQLRALVLVAAQGVDGVQCGLQSRLQGSLAIL